VQHVIDVDKDIEWYKETYEQPLLKEAPSLNDAIQFVRSIV
jgi:hypothetical protein